MKCPAKHTKFQPTNEQWLCPKCGMDNDTFVIQESDSRAIETCSLLHENDEVFCDACHSSWNGDDLAELMAKDIDVIVCPKCEGVGHIQAGMED